MHCTRTDSTKNDTHHALLCYFASNTSRPLSSPKRKYFLLHPHYTNSSEGRFLVERNILSILGPGYLCDRYIVVKCGKFTLTLRFQSDIIQKSSLHNCIPAVYITLLLSPSRLGLYPRLFPRQVCRGRGGTRKGPSLFQVLRFRLSV